MKKHFWVSGCILALGLTAGLAWSAVSKTTVKKEKKMSVYQFEVKTIDGKEISLSQYKGKVLLIVNVASQCGYTPQYTGLENLYEKYKDKNFAILGFPCNQFGKQEPGTEAEIKTFCDTKYHVKFPLFSKIEVNGPHAHAVYQFLKKTLPGTGNGDIGWNFTKFLIDRNGVPVKRFDSGVKPEDLDADVKGALGN